MQALIHQEVQLNTREQRDRRLQARAARVAEELRSKLIGGEADDDDKQGIALVKNKKANGDTEVGGRQGDDGWSHEAGESGSDSNEDEDDIGSSDSSDEYEANYGKLDINVLKDEECDGMDTIDAEAQSRETEEIIKFIHSYRLTR